MYQELIRFHGKFWLKIFEIETSATEAEHFRNYFNYEYYNNRGWGRKSRIVKLKMTPQHYIYIYVWIYVFFTEADGKVCYVDDVGQMGIPPTTIRIQVQKNFSKKRKEYTI